MHAVIDPVEIGEEAEARLATIGEGVEHPDLDVRVGIEGHRVGVATFYIDVIEEQPDPDTALCRAHETLHQDSTRGVCLPDVVLDVQGFLRQVAHRHTGGERLAAVTDDAESRLARVPRRGPREVPPDARVLGFGIGRGGFARIVRRKAGTTLEEQRHHKNKRDEQPLVSPPPNRSRCVVHRA